MTCQEIQNLLPGYWENLLSSEERSLIESHLSFCHLCRQSLVDLKDSEYLLNHLEEVEPPPFFEQRIMARVTEEAGKKRGLLRKFFFPIHIKIPIQAMATLLIVVLAVYLYQKNEPEMKAVSPFPVPFTEFQKGPVETEFPKSSKTPPETAASPLQAPGGDLYKKDQPRLAAAPPAAVSESAGRTAELTGPKEKEKIAVEKPITPMAPSGDKEPATAGRQALSKPQVEEQESLRALDAPGKERKKKDEMAEKGVPAEKSVLLKSAPAPTSIVRATVQNRSVIDLTIQVTDTDRAIREVEERLSRMGARIIERMDREGKAFLKAEMAVQKVALFLDQLKEVGRVDFNKDSLDVQEGKIIVSIHISKHP
jgi:hypothetical protein